MKRPEVSVIGLGALGTVLTKALLRAGYPVKSIYNRTENIAEALAASNGIKKWGSFPFSLDELGSLIFVTVPDSSIQAVAGKLAQIEGEETFKGRTVVHCSGNKSADLLEDLKTNGAQVASFHPLQTFTEQSVPDDFKGIYFSLQGDQNTFPLLQQVARRLGAQTLEVNPEQKSRLHAAAVMGSNYLNALLQSAVEVGSTEGLPSEKVKQALLPLVKTTLQNTGRLSFEEALSGPIKRGDITTVENHLAMLDGQDELRELYCMLGLRALKTAKSADVLDDSTIEKMHQLLHQQKPKSS